MGEPWHKSTTITCNICMWHNWVLVNSSEQILKYYLNCHLPHTLLNPFNIYSPSGYTPDYKPGSTAGYTSDYTLDYLSGYTPATCLAKSLATRLCISVKQKIVVKIDGSGLDLPYQNRRELREMGWKVREGGRNKHTFLCPQKTSGYWKYEQ